jgi:hypothetical protein
VVKESVAELWSTITDERERQACIVTAENVAGVRAVHDHLVWVEPMSGMAFPSPEDEAKVGIASPKAVHLGSTPPFAGFLQPTANSGDG